MKNIISHTIVLLFLSFTGALAQVTVGKPTTTNSSVLLEFNDQRTTNTDGKPKGIVLPHVTSLDASAAEGTVVFHLDGSNSSLKIKNRGTWEQWSSVNNQALSVPNYSENTTTAGVLISDVANPKVASKMSPIISDINVTLDISHTYVADLILTLIAPSGTEVVLARNNGGSGDNFTGTTFDDAANVSISSVSAPFSGTYRSIGNLSILNGQNFSGDWKLRLEDRGVGDDGILNNWSITYCYDNMGSNTCLTATNTTQVSFDDTHTAGKVSTISLSPVLLDRSKFGVLELVSNNKAMVLPNINGVANFPNPASGMLVYDTERKALAFFNGNEWSFLIAQ